jgi:ketosteroid isomerase-like protein
MKRVLGLVLVAGLASISLAGCASTSGDAARSRKEAAQELARIDEAWSASVMSRSPDRVGEFYAEDAVAYPPDEPVAVGKVAATKVWATYLADPSFAISWKTNRAEVSESGDLGYTSGTYQGSYRGTDGKTVHERGKYLCVWKKQADGTWKAVHDMWNTDAK